MMNIQDLVCQKDMVDNVKSSLHVHGFDTCEFERACFDILAKNDKHLIMLKLLHNVDSFTYDQAVDLKNVKLKMNASAMLVGCIGRNFTLKKNHVYERFDIPVMDPGTFENTLDNVAPVFYSKKGKTVSRISSLKMKDMRTRQNISLEELSMRTGISKKTLHLGEKYSKMSADAVERIEEFFSVSITAQIDVYSWKPIIEINEYANAGASEKKAMDYFSMSGFDCMYLKTAPIRFINAHDDKLILSTILTNHKNDRAIQDLKDIAELSSNDKIIINLGSRKKSIDGVASVCLDELKKIQSSKKLFELIYERESYGNS